ALQQLLWPLLGSVVALLSPRLLEPLGPLGRHKRLRRSPDRPLRGQRRDRHGSRTQAGRRPERLRRPRGHPAPGSARHAADGVGQRLLPTPWGGGPRAAWWRGSRRRTDVCDAEPAPPSRREAAPRLLPTAWGGDGWIHPTRGVFSRRLLAWE